MKQAAITKRYDCEFGALEELSMNILREFQGKVIEAGLHIKSRISGTLELTLIRPMLSSEVSSGFKGLVEILRVQEVHSIKVYSKAPPDPAPDQGLLWRVEIYKNDDEIIIVRCADIKGLPDRET